MIFNREQQRRNIESLARFLERHVPRHLFTMSCFRAQEHCGTVGCALGWAPQSLALKRLGIRDMGGRSDFKPTIDGHHYEAHDFAAEVFGDRAYPNLFNSHVRVKTPKQWAALARRYLKETA